MNNLKEIPTAALEAELATRADSDQEPAAPEWAMEILAAVATEAGISVRDLVTDRSTTAHQVMLRRTAIAMIRHHSDANLSSIGSIWGLEYQAIYRALHRVEIELLDKGPISQFMRGVQKRLANTLAE